MGCSLKLFGYLHEVAIRAPAVQKASTSLAAVMQERAWGLASSQTKVTGQAS